MKRIVKMSFPDKHIAEFKANFEDNKDKIKAFPGCQHVELLQGKDQPNIFFTFSIWDNPEALEAYRHSDLFKSIWKKTKVLFDQKPKAWSLDFVG